MFSILFLLLDIVLDIAKATGLWVSVLLFISMDWIIKNVLDIHINAYSHPSIYPTYEAGMITIALIPTVYFTIRNVIRFFSGNPEFSLLGAIFRKKKNHMYKTKEEAINHFDWDEEE